MQKRQDSSKSIKRVKKEATQEFFNKKRATSAGTQFTFNKAPINKAEAKKEFIEDREKKQVKRTAFTAKLYRDDNELDEMKILAGDQFDSDIDEQTKPRDAKAQTKK
jgi:pyrimidine operon attenuation protein/uracil phosphoribosyltransferase